MTKRDKGIVCVRCQEPHLEDAECFINEKGEEFCSQECEERYAQRD